MKVNLLTKFLFAAALVFFNLNTRAASQAPVAAENGMVVTASVYLERDGNVVKGASTSGHLAAGVPGTAGN